MDDPIEHALDEAFQIMERRAARLKRGAHGVRVLRQRLHALGIHDPDIHALIIRILLDLEEGL